LPTEHTEHTETQSPVCFGAVKSGQSSVYSVCSVGQRIEGIGKNRRSRRAFSGTATRPFSGRRQENDIRSHSVGIRGGDQDPDPIGRAAERTAHHRAAIKAEGGLPDQKPTCQS
jgi:hypothetical protein